MRIFKLLKEDHVIFDLKSGDKEHVLKEFVSALKERELVSKEKAILEELLKKRELGQHRHREWNCHSSCTHQRKDEGAIACFSSAEKGRQF